ncbi:MAG: hypothetical protein NVS3B21_34380 [Acidimicrobiales bacterium]
MSQIQEALAAAQVTPLIQKRISPLLLEYQRRYAPLLRLLPTEHIDSTTYYFNQRNSRPTGGFVTDGGARAQANSVYVQNSFNIRLLQAVGGVTGYAQAVTRNLVGDLLAKEVDGAVQSLLWDIETALLWGSDGATNSGNFPQFNGLDNLVATYSGTAQNALDQAHGALALRLLDLLIDSVETNAAMPVENGSMFCFVMSPTANSKLAQLLTNQQRFLTEEVAPGLTVATYRGIPIIKSSFLGAKSNTMGTVTSGTATTGGSLAAGAYIYRVAAVIARYGEIIASPEVTQTTTGATSTVTLTVAAPTGMPDGAGVLHYKVYRTAVGGATNTETLLGIVDAFDITGTPTAPNATTAIIDTGTALLTNSVANTGSVQAGAYQGQNAGQSPRNSGDEDIYLIPKDPNFLVRPYVRDITPLDVAPTITAPDTLPFAIATDTCLAVRAPKYVGRLSRVVSTL